MAGLIVANRKMTRPRKQMTPSAATPIALSIALLMGAGIFYCAEVTWNSMGLAQFPAWRAHMGSASLGLLGFMLCLFLLESLGKGSRRLALRSTMPWAPLAVLTAAATLIHIPAWVVVMTVLVYSPWACLKTCAVH